MISAPTNFIFEVRIERHIVFEKWPIRFMRYNAVQRGSPPDIRKYEDIGRRALIKDRQNGSNPTLLVERIVQKNIRELSSAGIERSQESP
jgi:hypothetical protein